MTNNTYNYTDCDLWYTASWKERSCVISPLAREIEAQKHEEYKTHMKTAVPEGLVPDARTKAVTYDGFVEKWAARGMKYYCRAMMDVRFLAMIPERADGHGRDMDVLMVLHDADGFDPAWAMDTMQEYEAYNEYAAEKRMLTVYVVTGDVDPEDMYIRIMQEVAALFHVDYRKVWLDVSALVRKDGGVREPDNYRGLGRKVDYLPVEVPGGQLPVIDVSDIWMDGYSLLQTMVAEDRYCNVLFDRERFFHSTAGERLAEGLRMEYDFSDSRDPELVHFFEKKGLIYSWDKVKGEDYLCFAPKGAGQAGEPLPVVCIMQEVNHGANPHLAMTAIGFYYQFIRIAAQGDCILLLFALESPEDNDLLHDAIQDVAGKYPVDPERIYVVGQSHNGHFALGYARRHPDEVAAVVSMGDDMGLAEPQFMGGDFKITEEQIDEMARHDMPTMNISGACEHSSFVPVAKEGHNFREGYVNNQVPLENRIKAWQRRLRSCDCPVRTTQEITASIESTDYAERILGVPADRTWVQYMDGVEYYFADIKNRSGRYHLRIAAAGNMPHAVSAGMVDSAWQFMRQFARDRKTGAVKELADARQAW